MSETTDTAEKNARRVVDYLKRGWNDGTFDADAVSDEYVAHVNRPETTYTFQEMRAIASEWREAFPDLHLEIPDTIATDQKVAIRYQWTGTHEAEILGLAPTGATVEVNGMGQFRVEDGRLVEAWYTEDLSGLREQLEGGTE